MPSTRISTLYGIPFMPSVEPQYDVIEGWEEMELAQIPAETPINEIENSAEGDFTTARSYMTSDYAEIMNDMLLTTPTIDPNENNNPTRDEDVVTPDEINEVSYWNGGGGSVGGSLEITEDDGTVWDSPEPDETVSGIYESESHYTSVVESNDRVRGGSGYPFLNGDLTASTTPEPEPQIPLIDQITDSKIRNRLAVFKQNFGIMPDHVIANRETIQKLMLEYMESYGLSEPGEIDSIYDMTIIYKESYPDGRYRVI